MKKIFTFLMICSMFSLTFSSQAQKYVKVPPTTDWANPSDLYPVIMGDTLANGNRVDNNTIYQLENGGFYIISSELVNNLDWDLQIEAEDLTNTVLKPAITRIPNADGTYPSLIFAEGNLTLRNIWIISGEKGPLEDHDWGKIRIYGENTRVIVEDCIIEKDRGGLLQVRGSNPKIYVNNTVLRNGGGRRKISGNGRAIDGRGATIDTLIVTNCTMYNITDRIFRSMGATEPHNYIKFDHNTIFNHFGRHGCFEFAKVNKLVVTNNLLANPMTSGTTPFFTDEQTQDDSDAHFVFTVDGVDITTDVTFSNNNIFWSQDMLDYYASNDSVSRVEVYSAELKKKLVADGVNPDDTYITEILELNSVPTNLYELLTGTYADPNSTTLFDIIVEDIDRAGTAYDSGNLFDFSTFDAGYSRSSQSAKGDTEGKSIGAVKVIATSINSLSNSLDRNLSIYPNPFSDNISLSFNLDEASDVSIDMIDITGRMVKRIASQFYMPGNQVVKWNDDSPSGIYIIKIQTNNQTSTVKVIKR